jgi:hypothetical protein
MEPNMSLQDTSAARVAARSLVEQIVRDNGFVREGSLESMKPDVRREVEEALLAKDKKIGASVLTYCGRPVLVDDYLG